MSTVRTHEAPASPGFVRRRASLFGSIKPASRRALREIIEAAAAEPNWLREAETVLSTTPGAVPLGAVRASASPARPSRTVAEIRPRPAVTLEAGMSVTEAAKRMQAANSDAALVCERVGSEWKVQGILTDTDVMRKVVAAGRDPDAVTVDAVMTRNPQVVAAASTAENALCTMIENRFRHLPVVGAAGVVGVLDIAKCLGDALGRMQNHQLGHALSLQALFDQERQEAGGGPDAAMPPCSIASGASAQEAAMLMAARGGAVLVHDDAVHFATSGPLRTSCAGILSPKDLLFRLVARELPPRDTPVRRPPPSHLPPPPLPSPCLLPTISPPPPR
jgi:CBS domain-containing protein